MLSIPIELPLVKIISGVYSKYHWTLLLLITVPVVTKNMFTWLTGCTNVTTGHFGHVYPTFMVTVIPLSTNWHFLCLSGNGISHSNSCSVTFMLNYKICSVKLKHVEVCTKAHHHFILTLVSICFLSLEVITCVNDFFYFWECLKCLLPWKNVLI